MCSSKVITVEKVHKFRVTRRGMILKYYQIQVIGHKDDVYCHHTSKRNQEVPVTELFIICILSSRSIWNTYLSCRRRTYLDTALGTKR